MKQVPLHRLSQIVLYIMGYLLLLEWLYPLKTIADIDNMYIFYIFLILPFILSFLMVKTALKILVLVLYVFWANYFLYYYDAFSFFNIQWIFAFAADFMQSVVSLLQFNLNSMSFSFQTLLLFLLLWVMTYLIRYWVMVQRSIFLFFFLSVLYVTILDTFTPYDGDLAIVRLFIIGILLVGNLTFFRLIQRENLFIRQKQYGIWLLPLIIMIAISSILGFASPKLPAQWPDPVPFFVSYSEKYKSKDTSSVNKVGYGFDDSTLGGDFIGDNTIVFTAKVSEKHYWKIESKVIYTGKGWVSAGGSRIEPFNNGEEVPDNCCYGNVEKSDLLIDEVDVKLPYVHIPYAEPMIESSIVSLDSDRGADVSFLYTPMNNQIVSVDKEGQRIKIDGYKSVYRMPVFDLATLREVNGMPKSELFYTYTDFPDVTPPEVLSRLQQLAESITKDKTNWYDKAKAIEDYFDKPEFVYDHENIPYPQAHQDFVEQFLFETKRGYCDHFSTSMAVLLRTIGIPTRWVKGYTEGEYNKYEDEKVVYEITNNNAHSWVEVYFPNTGWVPFEPTKGYSNPIRFEDSQNVSAETNTPEQEKVETKKPEPKEQEQVTAKQETSFNDKVKAIVDRWSDNWPTIMASIGVVVLFVITLIVSRRKWLPYLWFWYFRRKDTEEETFVKAYAVLLKQLQRSGLKRMQDQTLREYAIYVDEMYEIKEMSELTFYYERIVYRGEKPVENWKKAKILWKKVMKKTIT